MSTALIALPSSAETQKSVETQKPASNHYLGIQILRGLAALVVVIHHIGVRADTVLGTNLHWLSRGAFGVDIFFPISGFVIYLSTQALLRKQKPGVAREFAVRRLVRIAPLYWMFTIIKIVLALVAPGLMLVYVFHYWHAIASFLFLFCFNEGLFPVVGVGWTLNYEMFFYLIVLLAIVFKKDILPWCTGAIISFSLIGLFVSHRHAFSYYFDPLQLEFLAGMYVAKYSATLRQQKLWLGLTLILAAIAAVLMYDPDRYIMHSLLRPLVWGVPGVLLVAGFVCLENHIQFRRMSFMLLLGDASYALYLSHMFLLPAAGKLAAKLHGLTTVVSVFFVVGLVVSVAFAVWLHLKVELPLIEKILHWHTSWSMRSEESEAYPQASLA